MTLPTPPESVPRSSELRLRIQIPTGHDTANVNISRVSYDSRGLPHHEGLHFSEVFWDHTRPADEMAADALLEAADGYWRSLDQE